MTRLNHLEISANECTVAEKLKAELFRLGYYFRKNKSEEKGKDGKYNLILINHSQCNLDSTSFKGILLLSQYRRELCFISAENARKLRVDAFNFACGVWSRKNNVLGPEEPRTIYVEVNHESKLTRMAACLCENNKNIDVPCRVLSAKDVLSGKESISNFINRLHTLHK